jgi:hypothetical protein
MPMLALFGCGDPKEDEAKAAGESGKVPRKAVTVAAASSPSILDQAKATKRFSLPDGLFEADVIGDETAQELLVAAGLVFPEGTSAEFDREANELEVTHFPTDLMLAEAVVDSWRWVGWAKKADGILIVEEKLKQIVIPKVEFADTRLEDALKILASESVRHDRGIGSERGVKVSLSDDLLPQKTSDSEPDPFGFDGGGESDSSWVWDTPITLRLSNIPLGEALRYTTALAHLRYYLASDGVVVSLRHGSPYDYQQTQVFQVPSNFLDLAQAYEDSLGDGDLVDPFSFSDEETEGKARPKKVRELMESAGISFPSSSREIWDPARSLLIVKNTPDQLELVEAYISFLAQMDADSDWAQNRESQFRGKLSSIQIPRITIQDAEIWGLISDLNLKVRAYDQSATIWNRGIPIRYKEAPLSEAELEKRQANDPFADPFPEKPKVTVELIGSSIGDVLQEIARQINCTVDVDAVGAVLKENP